MNALASSICLVLVLQGCASGPSAATGTPGSEVGARRVAEIFGSRHLRPRRFDEALCAALFAGVLDAMRAPASCRNGLEAERATLDEALLADDFSFASRAANHCLGQRVDAEHARALTLNAFAKAHDPHSAFVTDDALAAMRAEIHHPGAEAKRVRGRTVEHAGARIALIEVPTFYLRSDRSTSQDVAYVAQQLASQGAQVLVLDVRGNTGGVQSEAIKLVGVLAGAGPVAQVVDAAGAVEVLTTDAVAIWQGPLLVVVDALSASMTEVAAAALQDRGRALVVGQRTHGKGTGQTLVLLSSPRGGHEGALRISDRRFHRLDGRPLQRDGVTPDVPLPGGALVTTERERQGALSFDAIAAIDDAPAPTRPPDASVFPFSAAVSWLATAQGSTRTTGG